MTNEDTQLNFETVSNDLTPIVFIKRRYGIEL